MFFVMVSLEAERCFQVLVGQASACPLAFIGCEAVRKPRSEGLRRSNGAQAGVPVPLKGASVSVGQISAWLSGRQACARAFIGCEAVREPRSEGLRRGESAQAIFSGARLTAEPVPLKGADSRRLNGRSVRVRFIAIPFPGNLQQERGRPGESDRTSRYCNVSAIGGVRTQ